MVEGNQNSQRIDNHIESKQDLKKIISSSSLYKNADGVIQDFIFSSET